MKFIFQCYTLTEFWDGANKGQSEIFGGIDFSACIETYNMQEVLQLWYKWNRPSRRELVGLFCCKQHRSNGWQVVTFSKRQSNRVFIVCRSWCDQKLLQVITLLTSFIINAEKIPVSSPSPGNRGNHPPKLYGIVKIIHIVCQCIQFLEKSKNIKFLLRELFKEGWKWREQTIQCKKRLFGQFVFSTYYILTSWKLVLV